MSKELYSNILNDINHCIESFNSELKNHSLKMDFLFDLNGLSWVDLNLGKANYQGVYIMLGKDEITFNTIAYIGKASMESSIGRRIYAHFCHSHEQKGMPKYTFEDNPHATIEYVYGVNFSKEKLTFMAPALEEYLITNISSNILLNVIKKDSQ